MDKVKVVVIGAGGRGSKYTKLIQEHCPILEVVAVADPNPVRIDFVRQFCDIPDTRCYKTGLELLEQPKMADAAIIATQDRGHFEIAMRAIEQGYHLLLEKPIAPTPEECLAIEAAAKKKGVCVLVCHVLRFTPFFTLVKKTLDEGRIGKIKNLILVEGVEDLHYSHSYIRGDWHNEGESAPMLLAKSCHDIDLLQWLADEKSKKVQSFGSLTYFCRDNKPEGAPEFCYQGCPHEADCPYSTIKLYRNRGVAWFARHATKKPAPTPEDIEKLITQTHYGKCVFQCDNDVVDQQVVNIEYESGATASFVMSAFNAGGRRIRIMGTEGELEGHLCNDFITVFDFKTRQYEKLFIKDAIAPESIVGGHAGGDNGIIQAFSQLLTNTYHGNAIADISTSVENHLTAYAAEESRHTDTVVFVEEYTKKLQGKI